jgi:RNA polymerase sigma-70 factor, ECF subfamily
MTTNEPELIERIKQGDIHAFEMLFKTYYVSLCNFCNKIVKDPDTAEEIVQDFFARFWDKRYFTEINTSVKSYLFRAVYNNAFKYLRHQKIIYQHENYTLNQNDNFQLPDNLVEIGEMEHIIRDTLKELPERSCEIFELNRNKGLKYQEIAEKLDISVKTVEAHITSVLKILRINLKDYFVVLLLVGFYFEDLFFLIG